MELQGKAGIASDRALERALRAQPGVLDARVGAVGSEPGEVRRVAWVCGPGASALPATLSEELGLDFLVPVSRLPLDVGGEAGDAADLPIWDSAALGRVEATLGAEDGVAEVAVATVPGERPGFLSRARLVPEATPEPATAPPADPVAERAELGARLSEREAVATAERVAPPPDYPRSLPEALERAARTDKGVTCVDAAGVPVAEGYAALRSRALRILGGLQAIGVRPGEILLLDAGTAPAFIGGYWACQLGGLVPAPLVLPDASADPAAFERLSAAWEMLGRPRLLAGPGRSGELAARLPQAEILEIGTLEQATPGTPAPPPDPDETALILLTSGSTGVPKGVRQSHATILAMSLAAAVDGWGLRREAEVFFNWMPLDHVGACLFLVTVPVILACDQVHSPTAPLLAEPLRWVELTARHRVTVSWAPNFAFGLIADAVAAAPELPRGGSWDLSALRILVNGGEAVTEGSLRDFLAALAPCGLPGNALRPSFGMSETCAPITRAELGHGIGAFASLGGPVAGCALRIAGADGALLKEGELGELQLRGPQVFQGYHGRDDLTEAAFADGWFRTGDVGFLAGGQLYLTGRIKDSINVNGAKFFAHEIEAAAARTPGVERAGVAAVAVRPAGAETDRVAVFFGAPLGGPEDDDVLRALVLALRGRLARELGLAADYLVPVEAGAIPRTGIGKIARPLLQQRFLAGDYDAAIERVARLVGGPERCRLTLHRRRWVERAPLDEVGVAPRVDLVFARDPALLAALPEAIRRRAPAEGAGPAPEDVAGHRALLEAIEEAGEDGSGAPGTLLHLWACEEAAGNRDDAAAYRSLLSLGRAIAALPAERRPRQVLAASRGALTLGPGETPAPGRALLAGLVRSLALALPGVRWRLLDLDEPGLANLAEVLAAEGDAGAEPLAAWRHGRRFVARFEAVEPEPPGGACGDDADGRPVRRGDLWLVAGGLGGLGRIAAERLLEQGARLLLVGRTAAEALAPERAEALRRLEALGAVRYVALDIGDAAAVRAAVEAAETETGRPLAGALHLAGVGRPVPLAEDDGAELPAMRRAALDGLAALADLLPLRPRAQLVVAGSIVGAVGGQVPGYAAVSAAAAEASAALIAAGARVSYLAFSSWSGVGMSAGRTSEALLRADGLLPLEADAGLVALEAALWRPGSSWLVGLDAAHPLHAAYSFGEPCALLRPVAWLAGPDGAIPDAAGGAERAADALGRPGWVLRRPVSAIPRRADGSLDLARLAAGAGGQRRAPRDETERRVARIFGEVLGVPSPAADDDFFVAGGSSLLAARLAAQLSKRFFVELPAGAVFRQPTVAGLTRELRALEPQPGLVDSVAEKLSVIEKLSPSERAALQSRLAGSKAG